MSLNDQDREGLSDREKQLVRMRSIINYSMGVFFIGVGFFFSFPLGSAREYIQDRYDPLMILLFSILCWIYGIFRIYRGYKKNYFRNQ